MTTVYFLNSTNECVYQTGINIFNDLEKCKTIKYIYCEELPKNMSNDIIAVIYIESIPTNKENIHKNIIISQNILEDTPNKTDLHIKTPSTIEETKKLQQTILDFLSQSYTYKQFHGETIQNVQADVILRKLYPDYKYRGIMLEIGAFEPILLSNSYHFEKNFWEVYCIEPNPQSVELLKAHRRNVIEVALSDNDADNVDFTVVTSKSVSWTAGFSALKLDPQLIKKYPNGIADKRNIKVKTQKLDTLLDELNLSKPIDIISIDIEGGEYDLLKSFNFEKYSPKVIMIENHFNTGNIRELILSKGYTLYHKISYNEYYVKT